MKKYLIVALCLTALMVPAVSFYNSRSPAVATVTTVTSINKTDKLPTAIVEVPSNTKVKIVKVPNNAVVACVIKEARISGATEGQIRSVKDRCGIR